MRRGAIFAVLVLAAVALALGTSPGVAADFTVYVDAYNAFNAPETMPPVSGGWGGEFQIRTAWTDYETPNQRVDWGYPTRSLGNANTYSFATFCVETTQYLSEGVGPYDVSIADFETVTGPAAFLYDSWYSGNLTGWDANHPEYEYAYSGYPGSPSQVTSWSGSDDWDRSKDARELQRLLWRFRDQQGFVNYVPTGAKYQSWLNVAIAQTGYSNGVRAMKLKSGDAERQDLLVMVRGWEGSTPPIPEPGTFALLATGGLGLLPLLRRRRTT